jgi:hypothetical protein
MSYANYYPSNYRPVSRPTTSTTYYPTDSAGFSNFGTPASTPAFAASGANIVGGPSTGGQFSGGSGTGFTTEAPGQINVPITEEKRAEIDRQWFVQPYAGGTSYAEWKKYRDYQRGGRRVALAKFNMGGNTGEIITHLIGRTQYTTLRPADQLDPAV